MIIMSRVDGQHNGPRITNGDHGLSVLVVDDDADTADTMVILLGHWGFAATAVRNGLEALRAVQTDTPDVVLLDIGMPGMDGLEVAKRVRSQVRPNGKTPFLIAVSGYG